MIFGLVAMVACKAPTGSPIDGDGDGYVEDDCDDDDPLVHPGAIDLWNDDLDADCDGEDRRLYELGSLHLQVDGSPSYSRVCDLTDDGVDDIVVGRPYQGQTRWRVVPGPFGEGVFAEEGPAAATLVLSEASVNLVCADFTGDGRADFGYEVTERFGQPGLAILPQPVGGFAGDLDDATVRFFPWSFDPTYDDSIVNMPDVDGDGVHDVLFRQYRYPTPQADAAVLEWLWRGGDHPGQPFTEVAEPFSIDQGAVFSFREFVDLDLDGVPELLACSPSPCLVLSGYAYDGSPFGSSLLGSIAAPGNGLGSAGDFVVGDFDGDGQTDDLALGSRGGGVVVYRDAPTMLTEHGTALPSARLATQVGPQIDNIGDLDGDGADDIVVTTASSDNELVISGRQALANARKQAASLFQVRGPESFFGQHMVGDLDLDGRLDVGWRLPTSEPPSVGMLLTGSTARGTPGDASLPDPDATCDFSEILGTWSRTDPGGPTGDYVKTVVFDVPGPIPVGALAGRLRIDFPGVESCVFDLACSPDPAEHRTYAHELAPHPEQYCVNGWTDWAVQFDGTLREQFSQTTPGGEGEAAVFDRVEP